MAFEIIKHTADVKIRITGRDMAELLDDALKGMNEIMQPVEKSNIKYKKSKIDIASVDRSALVVDFLSDLLAQAQIQKVVWTKVKFIELSDKKVVAELEGREIEEYGDDIKAVTYHGAEVIENDEGMLEITILFDI